MSYLLAKIQLIQSGLMILAYLGIFNSRLLLALIDCNSLCGNMFLFNQFGWNIYVILTDFAFLVKFPDNNQCPGQCGKEKLCFKASRNEFAIYSNSCCLPVAEKFDS